MTPKLLDPVILQTDFPDLQLHASGKVRDVYQLDNDRLLFVATDRISAFDYVLATGIPHKGRVLSQISLFWFDFLSDLVPNHVITADVERYPEALQKYADQLRGRSMVVQRAEMFPVECVVRGYISGSAWKEYQATGKVCGIALPVGLRESEALPEPIFTPATKAVSGHDENISFARMCEILGTETSSHLRDITLRIYKKAAAYARQRGIIIADTKFEFGRTAKGITLADEVLTPDSSASGPRTSTRRDEGRNPTTSNTFAITWKRFTGTSSRLRPLCRPRSPAGPAKSMSTLTSRSPGTSWMCRRRAAWGRVRRKPRRRVS